MGLFDLRDLFRGRSAQERIDALHLRPDLAGAAVALVADERVDVQVVRLEALLTPDETVRMLVEGRHQRQMGLLLLTTTRVLFRPHGEGSPATFELPLPDVSEPQAQTRSMTGRVILRTPGAVLEVDRLLGTLADQFAAAVREQQDAADEQRADTAQGRTPRDPLQELVDLRERHVAGLIDTAVYEAEKARLLGEI